MTFNIRFDNPADGENAWPNRRDMVAGTIAFHGADLVGVQEALKNQIVDLEARLPEYAWFGQGRDDGKEAGEFCPVFFRSNRFKLLEHGTFWLCESPERPGRMGWDAVCPRIVTWGRMRDQRTGGVIFIFNTHFDHRGRRARWHSAQLLRSRADALAPGIPAVITGDFNSGPGDDPWRVLTEDNEAGPAWRDAHGASESGHYGGASTFNGFQSEILSGRRIDMIFVRPGMRVLRHGVIQNLWDGRFVSDHYPVLAEVLPEETGSGDAIPVRKMPY